MTKWAKEKQREPRGSPEGAKREQKVTKESPKRTKGNQKEHKASPKGTNGNQKGAKGSQRGAKRGPKGTKREPLRGLGPAWAAKEAKVKNNHWIFMTFATILAPFLGYVA